MKTFHNHFKGIIILKRDKQKNIDCIDVSNLLFSNANGGRRDAKWLLILPGHFFSSEPQWIEFGKFVQRSILQFDLTIQFCN